MLRYLKSREFWLIILGFISFGALVYLVFFYLFLPSYTKHNESVVVPTVSEGDLDQAIEKLVAGGLRYEVADSIYVSNLPPSAVIAQDPPANSDVKPGRKIYLTVNKRVPPMVRIPKVFNVSTYQAKLLLDGAGLRIKKIEYIPYEFKNLVRYGEYRGKRVKEGDTLPKFSELVLFVGRGLGSQRVEIPDLVGLNYLEAISQLHKIGLNIGPVRFDPGAVEEKGTVIRQEPNYYPGDSMILGKTVTMFIAGPEPEEGIEDMIFEESGDGEGDDGEDEENSLLDSSGKNTVKEESNQG